MRWGAHAIESGGRKAVGLGGFKVVAHVERADVPHALLATVIEEGKERAQRPEPSIRVGGRL
jgi:hypothetical protein